MASLKGGGGPPRVTPFRVDTGMEKMWLNLQRTLDKRDVGRWELRSCDETIAEKGAYHFEAMTKKVASFLRGKIRLTPSVAAPGETNPSDATAEHIFRC